MVSVKYGNFLEDTVPRCLTPHEGVVWGAKNDFLGVMTPEFCIKR